MIGRLRSSLVRHFVGYLVTGGSAAVIDLGVFMLLLTEGFGLVPSAALSFCVAAIFNFTISTRYVFNSEASTRRFLTFMVFAIIGLAINTGVTATAAILLPISPGSAKVVGIGTAFLFNFAANALIVFAAGAPR